VADDLLGAFERTFKGQPYLHRVSTTGDRLAAYLYEDLYSYCAESTSGGSYVRRLDAADIVLNTLNRVTGRRSRRADGTLGARVPSEAPDRLKERHVAQAPVATLQIGIEFKIVATKMTAQMDRVATDLRNQAHEFAQLNSKAIKVAIVGVNHANEYEGHEGERTYRARRAPAAEAAQVIQFVVGRVEKEFDELILLRYAATNIAPYPFNWVDGAATRRDYSAAILRIADLYQQRFP
jgi:hypothetical protein